VATERPRSTPPGRTGRGSTREEDGQEEGHDHPAGLADRPREAGVEEAVRRHRSGEEEPEVFGQEESGEGAHHRAEGHEREEGQEEPAEAEADEVVAELLVVEERRSARR